VKTLDEKIIKICLIWPKINNIYHIHLIIRFIDYLLLENVTHIYIYILNKFIEILILNLKRIKLVKKAIPINFIFMKKRIFYNILCYLKINRIWKVGIKRIFVLKK